MVQVSEQQASSDKYMLSGHGIIVGIFLAIAGVMAVWYGSLWIGVAVLAAGLLMIVAGIHYGPKHLRRSGMTRGVLVLDIIDIILYIFI